MKTIYLFSIRARRTGAALLLLAITSLLATAQVAAAASPSELLEQGIYSEETKGDVDAALKLYQQVVTEAKAGQAVAAQAQYRLGVCYLQEEELRRGQCGLREAAQGLPGSEGPDRAGQQVSGRRHALAARAVGGRRGDAARHQIPDRLQDRHRLLPGERGRDQRPEDLAAAPRASLRRRSRPAGWKSRPTRSSRSTAGGRSA